MVKTIFILDESFQTQKVLTINGKNTFFEDLYSLDLSSCTETFEFSTNVSDIKETDYVMFYYHKEYRLFQITEIEQEHSDGKIITRIYGECACLELLNNVVRPFKGEFNCISFLSYILQDTRWRIGKYSSNLTEKVNYVNIEQSTQIWSCIQEHMSKFGYEFSPRVTYKNGHIQALYLDIFATGDMGEKTYKRFEYGRNVTGIIKKKDLYEFCTALILDTKENILDVEYNADGYVKEKGSDVVLATSANKTYNYGRDYIYSSFEDNDSMSGQEAVDKAVEELKNRCIPRFDYEVTTAMTYKEYKDVNIGDTVYVIDHTFKPRITLEARVGNLEISFTDRGNCTCNLTNFKEVRSKINASLKNSVQSVIKNYFPITAEKLADGAVTGQKIATETFNIIKADCVGATRVITEELIAQEMVVANARIDSLQTNKANVTDLNAVNARIDNLDVGDLSATYARIEDLEAVNARIDTLDVGDLSAVHARINVLEANKADIVVLNAINGDIDKLKSDSANIQNLVARKANISDLEATNATIAGLDTKYASINLANIEDGCITSAMIGTGVIGTSQIADGSITDAKIVELSANRITAGTLSVDRLVLTGSNKSLIFALNNSGDLISTQVDTLDAYILTEKTITADKIVSKAITAEQIASKTITANEIKAGTITGNEIKANTINANHISGKELVGITIRNAENSFSVSAGGEIIGCSLKIGEQITNEFSGRQGYAFRITSEGDVRIGGYSAYVDKNGYTKGVAEITQNGTIWSCSAIDEWTYTKISEGKIEVANTAYDPEYNGGSNVLNSYIRLQNGQISIYSATDDKYSSYSRALYIGCEGIGSALGHVKFLNRIEVTGNIYSTKAIVITKNANGYSGVETSGEEVSLAYINSDNVSTYGYGSYANQGSYAYQAGTQLLGGDKVTIKSKNIIFLGCNDGGRFIRFYMSDEGAYGFRPNSNQKDIACGSATYPWKSVTAVTVNQTSDRTLKENIKYISNANTINDDTVTLQDCYNFIKNDLPIATYNYIHETEKSNKIGFIAQDLLCNADGTDNKVGQLIIDRLKYTEEDGKLTYDTNNLFGVMLSAMQVMANEIETLKAQLNKNE